MKSIGSDQNQKTAYKNEPWMSEIAFDDVESTEIDLTALKLNPKTITKRFSDAVYFGEAEEGKRQGKGIMKYRNGRIYEGEWDNDVRHGRGYERYSNGNTY